ncbi:MAG: hypothetical protein CMJ18_21805 [Phycisphaeraceae bacterium]|nr:hypothetical protein [Phycisphaeraceae bacterium]
MKLTPSDLRFNLSGADLVIPSEGGLFRYGNGFAFQAGPTTAGFFVNLRFGGYPVGDFEAGMDVVLFDDLATISASNAVPICRSDRHVRPDGKKRVVVRHTPKGGFVPHGALRADGSPHPGAGTGFLVGQALDFPMYGDGYYMKEDKARDMVHATEVHHLAYDGREFRKIETETWGSDNRKELSGWMLEAPSLCTAITDGDDLLFPMDATQGDFTWGGGPNASGVARWRYADGRWGPVEFVPIGFSRRVENPDIVYDTECWQEWIEPTVVRDLDGSLLFTARGVYERRCEYMIKVWRSTDGGATWDVLFEVEDVRDESPTSINTTADGTLYIFSCPTDHARDQLCLWLLRPDRSGVEEPIMFRDGVKQFGPPPKGPVWFMDHPNGYTVRLADGAWHHLLCHRVMDRGEHGGSEPSPQSGFYAEELVTPGPAVPLWKFE